MRRNKGRLSGGAPPRETTPALARGVNRCWKACAWTEPQFMTNGLSGMQPEDLVAFAMDRFHSAAREAVDRALERIEGRVPSPPPQDDDFKDVTAGGVQPVAPAPSMTLRALCDAFLETPERRDISPKTHVKERGIFRVLCDLLAALRVVMSSKRNRLQVGNANSALSAPLHGEVEQLKRRPQAVSLATPISQVEAL